MDYQQDLDGLQDLEDLQEINFETFSGGGKINDNELNENNIVNNELELNNVELNNNLEQEQNNLEVELETNEQENYNQQIDVDPEFEELDNNNLEFGNIEDDNIVDNIEDENIENNSKLDLERGTIIQLKDDNNKYIIVQIKDVYFDKNQNKFIRNYKSRQIKNKKLSHQVFNIDSESITEIINVNKVKKEYNDLEYSEEGDKEADLDEFIEEVSENNINDQNNNLVDLNDIDLDISDDIIEDVSEGNSFDFEEILDNNIVLDIEKELEESQILFTENEQEEDILDELVRLYSQKTKLTKKDINNIAKKIRLLQFLKYNYSQHSLYQNNLDNVDENSLKQKIIHKTQNYKPLLNKYLNNNYDNNFLIPVVHSINRFYEKEVDSKLIYLMK